jgi:purine-binding chemotaxis protein CheW
MGLRKQLSKGYNASIMTASELENTGRLLAFTIEGQRYGLSLSSVERVVHSVEITPLPKAPDIVLGVVNARGRVIPVFNLRRRFRLPEREIALSDHMIIALASGRIVSLAVDRAEGVIEVAGSGPVPSAKILPVMEYVRGVVKLEDGLVFIHDLDTFLSLEEERELDIALKKKDDEERK